MTQYTKHGQNEKARHLMRRSGYKVGGAIPSTAPVEATSSHPSPPALPTRKTGGEVSGAAAAPRLDKFSRGGHSKHKKPHVTVNVVNAPPPAPAAPPMGMAPKPMLPPGAGPMPPPGPGPGGPPMGLKTGGKVPKMTAGALSGEGRIEKCKAYGTKPKAK